MHSPQGATPLFASADNVRALTECPVCTENFDRSDHSPRILPHNQCGHVVCLSCIRTIMITSAASAVSSRASSFSVFRRCEIVCPLCKAVTAVSSSFDPGRRLQFHQQCISLFSSSVGTAPGILCPPNGGVFAASEAFGSTTGNGAARNRKPKEQRKGEGEAGEERAPLCEASQRRFEILVYAMFCRGVP